MRPAQDVAPTGLGGMAAYPQFGPFRRSEHMPPLPDWMTAGFVWVLSNFLYAPRFLYSDVQTSLLRGCISDFYLNIMSASGR